MGDPTSTASPSRSRRCVALAHRQPRRRSRAGAAGSSCKRLELASAAMRDRARPRPPRRIELADLKERVRKLEAIAERRRAVTGFDEPCAPPALVAGGACPATSLADVYADYELLDADDRYRLLIDLGRDARADARRAQDRRDPGARLLGLGLGLSGAGATTAGCISSPTAMPRSPRASSP